MTQPADQWGILSQAMQNNPSLGGLLGPLLNGQTTGGFLNWFLGRQSPGYAETQTQQDPNTSGALSQRALKAEQGTINDEFYNNAPYFAAGRADMKSKNIGNIYTKNI